MVGMALGMAFTRAAADSALAAWALFAALTWVHVAANVRAMRCLVLRSLNRPRLELLLQEMRQGAVRWPS
jgi:hypothetical protein